MKTPGGFVASLLPGSVRVHPLGMQLGLSHKHLLWPVNKALGADLLTSQLYAIQTPSVLPTLALASSEAGREFF